MKKILVLFSFIAIGLTTLAQEYSGVYSSEEASITLNGSDSELIGKITHEGTDYKLNGKVDQNSGVAYLEVTTQAGVKVADMKLSLDASSLAARIDNANESLFPDQLKLEKQ